MNGRPTLDVSGLPTVVFGPRSPLWWGVVGIIAIEGTMFAILIVAYFYLRGGAAEWPPTGVLHPGLGKTTIALLVLLATLLPMRWSGQAAERTDLRRARLWIGVATLLMILFIALRTAIFSNLTFRWDSHAYGSIVWTAMGLHTFHVLTGIGENLFFVVLLGRGPVQDKHLLDLRLNTLYWDFVVASWAVFYAIFYLDPGWFVTR